MTRILTAIFVLTINFSFAQKTNRTFADTTFKVGDLIKTPQVLFYICCRGCPDDGLAMDTKDTLTLIATFIKNNPKLIFQIDQHTDQRGTPTSNLKLSTDRANSIRQYLITKFSVDSTQIFSKGFGGSSPIISTTEIQKAKTKQEKEELHAQNRRTVLRVIGQK
jgi:OmpA family